VKKTWFTRAELCAIPTLLFYLSGRDNVLTRCSGSEFRALKLNKKIYPVDGSQNIVRRYRVIEFVYIILYSEAAGKAGHSFLIVVVHSHFVANSRAEHFTDFVLAA
jgi:hypothetical protein